MESSTLCKAYYPAYFEGVAKQQIEVVRASHPNINHTIAVTVEPKARVYFPLCFLSCEAKQIVDFNHFVKLLAAAPTIAGHCEDLAKEISAQNHDGRLDELLKVVEKTKTWFFTYTDQLLNARQKDAEQIQIDRECLDLNVEPPCEWKEPLSMKNLLKSVKEISEEEAQKNPQFQEKFLHVASVNPIKLRKFSANRRSFFFSMCTFEAKRVKKVANTLLELAKKQDQDIAHFITRFKHITFFNGRTGELKIFNTGKPKAQKVESNETELESIESEPNISKVQMYERDGGGIFQENQRVFESGFLIQNGLTEVSYKNIPIGIFIPSEQMPSNFQRCLPWDETKIQKYEALIKKESDLKTITLLKKVVEKIQKAKTSYTNLIDTAKKADTGSLDEFLQEGPRLYITNDSHLGPDFRRFYLFEQQGFTQREARKSSFFKDAQTKVSEEEAMEKRLQYINANPSLLTLVSAARRIAIIQICALEEARVNKLKSNCSLLGDSILQSICEIEHFTLS